MTAKLLPLGSSPAIRAPASQREAQWEVAPQRFGLFWDLSVEEVDSLVLGIHLTPAVVGHVVTMVYIKFINHVK